MILFKYFNGEPITDDVPFVNIREKGVIVISPVRESHYGKYTCEGELETTEEIVTASGRLMAPLSPCLTGKLRTSSLVDRGFQTGVFPTPGGVRHGC